MSYKRWYKTARWQKLRWSILVRDLFTCAMCGWSGPDTSKLVADHKDPHRGDPGKFWDASNLQVLCKRCHDSDAQRAEKSGRIRIPIGADGWPSDEKTDVLEALRKKTSR